ncbi:MAG: O-methyltransferase [Deinococcota bacterium]|jgi:predicted O-methyltransferase YrrM|nr:O-methyltransferase [Deinococcota bacterium]
MPEQERTLQDYHHYITTLFAPEDDALRSTREEMQRQGLRAMNVSASEGKLLHLLALLSGTKRILEIGTLGGYSTIWLARALPPDGKLISLEIDPHHAQVARRNVEDAGIAHQVEVRIGPAGETLKQLQALGESPFDLVFIDADKDSYPQYLELSLPLIREGGLILADNTLSHAALDLQADTGIDLYNTTVAAHPALVSILVPVLRGRGGLDGLLISIKRSASS